MVKEHHFLRKTCKFQQENRKILGFFQFSADLSAQIASYPPLNKTPTRENDIGIDLDNK